MIVWRISGPGYVAKALSGEGAFRFGGRWNYAGVPMIYTASTMSLALLEYRAHIEARDALSKLVLLKIEAPGNADSYSLAKLPKDWNRIPPSDTTRELGTKWARGRRTLMLGVPSVLLPAQNEYIVLINPIHPEMHDVKIINQRSFSLDERIT